MRRTTHHLVSILALVAALSAPKVAFAAGQPVFDWVNWLLERASKKLAEEVRDMNVTEIVEIGKELDYIVNAANPDIQGSFSNIRERLQELQRTSNAMQNLIDSYGGIEKSLEKFSSYKTFKAQPCFSQGTCTAEEVAKIRAAHFALNEFMGTVAESSLRQAQEQENALVEDGRQLQRLEAKAATAKGQTQAIKYGTEIGTARTKELMQIRASLNTIQRVEAVRAHAKAQDRAMALRRFERFSGRKVQRQGDEQ